MKHHSWTPRSLRGICGLVAERDWWCPYTTWAKTLTGMVEQIWVFYHRLDIFKAPFTVCINGSCSCQVLEGQYQAVRIVLGVQVRKYSKPNLVAFHCWLVGGKQNPTYIWAIGIDMYWLDCLKTWSRTFYLMGSWAQMSLLDSELYLTYFTSLWGVESTVFFPTFSKAKGGSVKALGHMMVSVLEALH